MFGSFGDILNVRRRIIIIFAASLCFHAALLAIELQGDGRVDAEPKYGADLVARKMASFAPGQPVVTTQTSMAIKSKSEMKAILGQSAQNPGPKKAEIQIVKTQVAGVLTSTPLRSTPVSVAASINPVIAQQAAETHPDRMNIPDVQQDVALVTSGSQMSPVNLVAPVVRAVPRYANNPRPVYPEVARRKGWQGEVRLKVQVTSEGVVGGLTIERTSGYPVLDRSARQTVRLWRFVPARERGMAVACEVIVPVNFQLPAEG